MEINSAHIVLVSHGEAESNGFLENFRINWRTLKHAATAMHLPWWPRLLISVWGAASKRLRGNGASPHNDIAREQARALERQLRQTAAFSSKVSVAFASADPTVESVLGRSPDRETLLLHSMIPTDSLLSCGLMCAAVNQQPRQGDTRVIARLWESRELVAAHQQHLTRQLEHERARQPLGEHRDRRCALVIALHGTLLRDTQGKVPDFHTGAYEKAVYGAQLQDALSELPQSPWDRVELAYLNHAVGGAWSAPTLDDCLARLEAEQVEHVYVYPAEHLTESVETRRLSQTLDARKLSFQCTVLPCLNVSEGLITLLALRVRQCLEGNATMRCDACFCDQPETFTSP